MPKKILVATSDTAFGEWLRASLVESGEYEAVLAGDAGEALSRAASLPAALVILDAELPGGSLSALVDALRALPARILILMPDNDPYHPAGGLSVDGTLQRPFALTDLTNLISSLKPLRPALAWLDDPARGEQDLNALLPDTGAQAALMVYEGSLWTWSGALDRDDADEIIERVNWQLAPRSGLARYLRLVSNGWEYLLYAISLAEGLALALLFPPDQPLTLAHAQTVGVAHALPRRVAPAPVLPEAAPADADEDQLPPDEEFGEEMEIDLSALLAGMPPPDPDGAPLFQPEGWSPAPEAETPPAAAELLPPAAAVEPAAPPPPLPSPEPQIPGWLGIEPSVQPAEGDTSPVKVSSQPGKTGPLRVAAAQPAPRMVIPPARPDDDLFTCLLLPRNPEVYLTGDLAEHLSMWLQQFCRSFGWRMEQLVIQPEYLMWSLHLPVGMSSSQAVRIFRQRTSERVYQRYPHLAASQDFWSPGYLSLPGIQPPSAKILRDFIVSTRQAQGYIVYY